MSGGEFDWGGRLRKGIGGAQRSLQDGRKPSIECKGIRRPDCDTDGWLATYTGWWHPVLCLLCLVRASPCTTGEDEVWGLWRTEKEKKARTSDRSKIEMKRQR